MTNMTAREALDQEMRQLLLELMLVSAGTTQSWNATGGQSGTQARPGQGHPEGRPAGGGVSPHDYWSRQYDQAESDEGRRAVIDAAREDLQHLAGRYQRTTGGETPEEYRARFLKETQGWSPQDVAQSAWHISEPLVRRWRTVDGRWPETGHKIEAEEAPDAPDLAARAHQMKAGGMSLRQIGMILGKDQKQIQRYLQRAA